MSFIFVFILPSVFGFKLLYNNVEKKDNLNLLIYESIILLLSNLICCILVIIKNKGIYDIASYASGNIGFSIAYIFLSAIIGCIISIILIFAHQYFNISVEVRHEKKTKKSNKNSK